LADGCNAGGEKPILLQISFSLIPISARLQGYAARRAQHLDGQLWTTLYDDDDEDEDEDEDEDDNDEDDEDDDEDEDDNNEEEEEDSSSRASRRTKRQT